jgi:hypothetical protein
MRGKQQFYTLFLLACLFFMAFQCDSNDPEPDEKYKFLEKVDLSPAQKSYNPGDTIWITFDNPDKKLFDVLSAKEVPADSVNLSFSLAFESVSYAPANSQGLFYEVINPGFLDIQQRSTAYGSDLRFSFGNCHNFNPQFRLGLKLKQKGTFLLQLLDAQYYGSANSVSFCKARPSFILASIEYKFSVTDGNKEVYLSGPPRVESPSGQLARRIDNKTAYVVKVD